MKAVILVGGYGTRLRPMTIYHPKSVFPFMNLPMVEHQIKALAAVGVKEVILAINYQGDKIQQNMKPLEEKYGIKITYSKEPEPYGTAGPLKLIQQTLQTDKAPFFVFNSDIVCDYPLAKLIQIHQQNSKNSNALGTIVLAEVDEPSRFGVVVTDSNQKIEKFVEKPKQFISNFVNAGIYLLDPAILPRIPENKRCMIEREIFPQMAEKSELYALKLDNRFWFDIGKPGDYIVGQKFFLQYYSISSFNESAQKQIQENPVSTEFKGNYMIDPSATISPNCKIGPNVVIGPNVFIGEGCCIKDTAILEGTQVNSHSYIENAILSWRCKIGKWVRIEGLTSFGEEVTVNDEVRIKQSMILPNVVVNRNLENETVMF